MIKSFRRSTEIILALLIALSVFTASPFTIEAASTNSSAWVFSTSDTNTVYNVSGRYFTYDGNKYQFTDDGSFSVDGTNDGDAIRLNGQVIATVNRPSGTGINCTIDFADSVYVEGDGSNGEPYVFMPNYIYYTENASGIGNTTAMAIDSDNAVSSGSGKTYITTHPGDGFKKYQKFRVKKEYKVQFLPNEDLYNSGNNYLCVSDGEYGTNYSGLNVTGNKIPFSVGNDTLYFIGKGTFTDDDTPESEPESLYQFSEMRSFKKSFEGTTESTYTVMWQNEDGSLLDIGAYSYGETPVYSGETPTKASDAWYVYVFSGWSPSVSSVTGDVTYTATFTATQNAEHHVGINADIFPTDSDNTYDISGLWFKYQNALIQLEENHEAAFAVVNNSIMFGSQTVAQIESKATAVYAGTVYVKGSGAHDDPYIFIPNYIYGVQNETVQKVKDGPTVDATNALQNKDAGEANPGDGFTAFSKIRVGTTDDIQFLPKLGTYRATASKGYLGVSKTAYGYRYSLANAYPFSFSTSNGVLYYYGVDTDGNNNLKLFSEYSPPLRSSFDDDQAEVFTVTWLDDDGTTPLATSSFFKDSTPVYTGSTPTKAPDNQYTYTFAGWTPAIVPITENTEYTATYNRSDRSFFSGHSITLNGDIGVNFFVDVTPDEIATGSGAVVKFGWTVENEKQESEYKLNTANKRIEGGKTYYIATCNVPAAEMTYPITASLYINGSKVNETDTYSVRQYAMYIINHPTSFNKNLPALAEALLHYGARSQLVFNRDTENLADAGLPEMATVAYEDIDAQKDDMRYNTESALGLKYQGSSIIFLSKTTLRHYYTIVDQTTFASVKDSANFKYGAKSNVIYFDKENIPAAELDDVQQFTIGGQSYGFSVLDYSKLVLNSNFDDSEKQLAMATYLYNQAANTYFDNLN